MISVMSRFVTVFVVLVLFGHLQHAAAQLNINVRLVNGTTASEGRVEVQYNASTEWGTVCDDGWWIPEATVVCNQLGFTNTIAVPIMEAYYGTGTGPILIDNLDCNGTESNLGLCDMRPWGDNWCQHDEDAGLMCLTNTSTETAVRIADGLIPSQGLVQVRYQNVWGTVCSNSWEHTDATVVCNQLGFAGGYALEYLYYGGGPMWMDEVECLGNETSLVDCPFDGWGQCQSCDRWTGAGVFCNDTSLINYNVRLVGNTTNQGRVEVQYNGIWGTVCDDYWSDENAQVICRMLGFTSDGAKSLSYAYYGQGSGDIFMDDVQCVGTETNIGHCPHISVGMNDCGHYEDAGVWCTPGAATALGYSCYPNGTVQVTNPNPGTFTHVMAVQNEGLSSATKCTVSTSGSIVLLTGCSQDLEITVYFSDRLSGDDDVFVGQTTKSFNIRCDDIADSGVERTVSNLLGATLEMTTQDSMTPSFTVSSALRSGSQTGPEVNSAIVGDTLYWTIDIPSDYNGLPSCTAYSGSSNSGSPSQGLVSNGCISDPDIVGDDFDNIDTGAVPLVKRLWTTLYVFRFYNSEDIYIECSVKLCPSSSSSCDLSCGGRKRAIAEKTDLTEMTLKTGRVLHILPDGGISGAPTLGGPVALIAVVAATLITLTS